MGSIKNIAIVGGGAAGYFAAIRAAEVAQNLGVKTNIVIFEQGTQVLKKVRISGGGRCNVTHHLYDINLFCQNYPRGHKELLTPMQSFQAQNTVEWFKQKGISLVAEADGRMFPTTNDSQTIIDCFIKTAEQLHIELYTNHSVNHINLVQPNSTNNSASGFVIGFKNKPNQIFDAVLLCTGSMPSGYKLATGLGHSITEIAPSLFSFKIKHALFKDLSGISFSNASIKLILPSKQVYKNYGDLLITHWGLSGPVILKTSAWAARALKNSNYKAILQINWCQNISIADLQQVKENNVKTQIINAYPKQLPKRFWRNLLDICKISPQIRWADVSNKQLNFIVSNLNQFECNVNGQNRFKEEFVECGGIHSKEINFKTMQSKLVKGLFFAGELLDVDGITGGFNFQNAWTTAWSAGTNLVQSQ